MMLAKNSVRAVMAAALVIGAGLVSQVSHEPRAYAQAAPTFTLDANSFAPDGTIKVKFGGAVSAPAGQSYWITIVKASAGDEEWGNWHYVKDGATTDELKVGGPGEYEVRLHDLYPKYAYKVLVRVKLSVKGTVAACESIYKNVPNHDKVASHTCTCAAPGSGSVWGTDMYTEDSNICTAAAHAGVIGSGGGTVTVAHAEGCSAYTGTKRNGVSSSNWGSYGGSFYFPGYGSGSCGAGNACPATFGSTKKALTCMCPAKPTGAVWGTYTYTNDSSICNAAIHAGVIGSDGGIVMAKPTAGCSKYNGSTKNGVTSAGWGPFQGSFYFPGKTNGLCQ